MLLGVITGVLGIIQQVSIWSNLMGLMSQISIHVMDVQLGWLKGDWGHFWYFVDLIETDGNLVK